MELPEIVTGLGVWLPIPSSSLVSVLAIIGVVWMSWRARSFQPIISRIWRFVAGNPSTLDEDIQKALQSEASLHHFRVETGIPCRTLAQAKRVNKWREDNDESLQDIARTRNKFDYEKCELKSLDAWFLRGAAGLGILLLVPALAFFLVMNQLDTAWVWFKDGGPQFTLSTNVARPIFHNKAALKVEDCGKVDEKFLLTTGFTAEQSAQLCGFFKTKDADAFVKKTVKEQKILSLFLALCFFVYGLWSIICLQTNSATKEMLGRLQKNAARKNMPSLGGDQNLVLTQSGDQANEATPDAIP